MIAVMVWLKEHKQLAALAGLLVAVFFAGLFAGRASVRQPAVHEVVQERAKADAKGELDQTVHAGAEKITITDYAGEPIQYAPPVLPMGHDGGTLQTQAARNGAIPTDFCRPIVVPGQDRIIRQTVIERGPSVTETHAQAEQHQELDRKLDLTVAPAGADALQLQLGLEDVLHLSGPRVAARVRLFGSPWWGEVSTKPLEHCPDGRWCPVVGAALARSF